MADDKSEDSAAERRSHTRHFVCIPAYVQRAETGPHIALIRDISLSGALILIRKRLVVPEPLDLSLHLRLEDGGGPVRESRASVVRIEQLTDDRAGLWRHAVGVRFEEPMDDIEAQIHDVSAQLIARFGKLK